MDRHKTHIMDKHRNTLKQAPNSKMILVLGILSIFPGSFSFGLLGIILSVITLSLASGSKEKVEASPDSFDESSLKQIKTGKVCAITGLILSVLSFFALMIYAIYFSASLLGTDSYYM